MTDQHPTQAHTVASHTLPPQPRPRLRLARGHPKPTWPLGLLTCCLPAQSASRLPPQTHQEPCVNELLPYVLI